MSLSQQITALRWGLVAQALIRHRDELLYLAQPIEDNGRNDTPEQKDCFRRAARSLGSAIAEAVSGRRAIEDSQPAPPRLPPTKPLSEEEFKRLGEEVANDPTHKGMMRQGRPILNIEMLACRAHEDDQWRAVVAREGCCGKTPMADGFCFGHGKCPRFFEAERAAAFVAGYLEWLDQINEDAALAAVAARLSVSSPIEAELSNV